MSVFDSDLNVLETIGAGTVLVFAFLLFCTTAFFALCFFEKWELHRKSRFGKHLKTDQSDRELTTKDFPLSVNKSFFAELNEKEKKDQIALDELRAKLMNPAYDAVPLTALQATYNDKTEVHPFNMKGETVDASWTHEDRKASNR